MHTTPAAFAICIKKRKCPQPSSCADSNNSSGIFSSKKVLVTTTTHIFRPSSEKLAQNEQELEQIWHTGNWAVIGTVDPVQPQKLQSPDPHWLQRAAELADLLIDALIEENVLKGAS